MILSLDTSANPLIMALYHKEKAKLVAELMLDAPATHGQSLLSGLDFLIKQFPGEVLSAIGVCVGPGSFTGLRVGLATVQGLAYSLNLPVVGLSSLEIMAATHGEIEGTVWAIMDARQKMLYAAPFCWEQGRLKRLAADGAGTPERFKEQLAGPATLLGNGAFLYAELFAAPGVVIIKDEKYPPRGATLAELTVAALAQGRGITPEELKPNYCRPSDAEARFNLPLETYNLW